VQCGGDTVLPVYSTHCVAYTAAVGIVQCGGDTVYTPHSV